MERSRGLLTEESGEMFEDPHTQDMDDRSEDLHIEERGIEVPGDAHRGEREVRGH